MTDGRLKVGEFSSSGSEEGCETMPSSWSQVKNELAVATSVLSKRPESFACSWFSLSLFFFSFHVLSFLFQLVT